ncbi:DUF2512 family protein [Cohnella hongkongensis]|uniref:DUF2512 family protein n=1 Tax=Cohnella hongkongensis TaxID=178337 RepID=A0ABV9FN87_9BACL
MLKWLLNGVIVVTLLMYYADVSFFSAAVTATVLTLIAYFVGDQMILRATNNTIATLSDAVLAFVVLWGIAYLMNWPLSAGEALVITAILGIAEWFLHRHLFRPSFAVRT